MLAHFRAGRKFKGTNFCSALSGRVLFFSTSLLLLASFFPSCHGFICRRKPSSRKCAISHVPRKFKLSPRRGNDTNFSSACITVRKWSARQQSCFPSDLFFFRGTIPVMRFSLVFYCFPFLFWSDNFKF